LNKKPFTKDDKDYHYDKNGKIILNQMYKVDNKGKYIRKGKI
jgi:hypothetical protein